jgi:hypothetical protein
MLLLQHHTVSDDEIKLDNKEVCLLDNQIRNITCSYGKELIQIMQHLKQCILFLVVRNFLFVITFFLFLNLFYNSDKFRTFHRVHH